MTAEILEVRRRDFSLSEEQQQISEVFAALFERECPTTRVRDAEPLGFDAELWRVLTETGVVSMALPSSVGGDGATLVDLALVAEAYGRALAPVPLIDAVVAARLIAATGRSEELASLGAGEKTATLALHPAVSGSRQLVSSGAVADVVVGLVDDELVLYSEAPGAAVSNLGSTPLAWRELSGPAAHRTVLADGPRGAVCFELAVLEWKALMAAAADRCRRRCACARARLCERASGVRRSDRDLSGGLASPGRRRGRRRRKPAASATGNVAVGARDRPGLAAGAHGVHLRR